MDYQELRKKAKERFKGYCRVCPVCDGRACAGEVPGMGGTGTGAAFKANVEALKKVRLNMRTIHGVKKPALTVKLFDHWLKTPILSAPMTGIIYNMGGYLSEQEFIKAIIQGSLAAGTIGMSGDGADPAMFDSGVKTIAEAGGKGIPFVKPREQQEVFKFIRKAEDAGAIAVGMDIDGAGLVTMALKGQPVEPKTPEELKEIIQSTRLPFILKGIMTVDEAEIAAEIGTAAIVVSNHGGRVLDHAPGAAEVLPEIAAKVEGKVVIMADGGVRSGTDVLKLLALGADMVLVGRPMAMGAFGDGADGVKAIIEKYTAELTSAMLLTGCSSVKEVKPNIIRS